MITFSNMYNIAMQNYYQFIIPRLNGGEVRKKFSYYRSLVKKGVAGFIVFGGELKTLKKHLEDLQNESELPLVIASDLERGLGQQVKGGTLFPPAMAFATAVKKNQDSKIKIQDVRLLRASFRAIAEEARYAGINTIFGPVLDINTNPRNPIISVRAFGEDPETVSFFGCEMIRKFQACGIAACGKHFPGHGDTEVDSHIKLPFVDKTLKRLKKYELKPFERAIEENVKMIMLGHLNVPALDNSGIPVSISKKAVKFLREKMKFNGILITDAMNMGGIGTYSEEKAALMSLEAGIDILLHPTDPEKIVSFLKTKKVLCNAERLTRFRNGIDRTPARKMPDIGRNHIFSDLLTEKAVRLTGDFQIREDTLLLVLNDDEQRKGLALSRALKKNIPTLKIRIICKGADIQKIKIPASSFVIAAVFSETKAWKGGVSNWLSRQLAYLKSRTNLFVSFGSPYLFDERSKTPKIFAYWDSETAQRAVARMIGERGD
jgi:beta-glucosidase-like glycosyl hydrolase